jgi:hypothetical protein
MTTVVQVAIAKQVNIGATSAQLTSTGSANFSVLPTTMNALWVWAVTYSAGNPQVLSSVSDTWGSTWSVLDNVNSGATFNVCTSTALATSLGAVSGAYTVTMNFAGSVLVACGAIEIAGLQASPLDAVGTAINDSSSANLPITTSGSVSVADFISLFANGTEHATDPTFSQPASYTSGGQITASAGITGFSGYRILTGQALTTISATPAYSPNAARSYGVLRNLKSATTSTFRSRLAMMGAG